MKQPAEEKFQQVVDGGNLVTRTAKFMQEATVEGRRSRPVIRASQVRFLNGRGINITDRLAATGGLVPAKVALAKHVKKSVLRARMLFA